MDILNTLLKAADGYYNTGNSELSDKEYDDLLNEARLKNIPVGAPIKDGENFKHPIPALSLKSTKSIDEVQKFIGDKHAEITWKLDGMSILLYYSNGKFWKAVSRGDGYFGKDITETVKYINGIPKTIPDTRDIMVRGEAIISKNNWKIIQNIDIQTKYVNPRNSVVGLINSYKNPKKEYLKLIDFLAYEARVINDRGEGGYGNYICDLSKVDTLNKLLVWKFDTPVSPPITTPEYLVSHINRCSKEVDNCKYFVDGLVIRYSDWRYGDSLGGTKHHPKHSIAYKWQDDLYETTVLDVEWSVSNTGLLTPICIFDPIKIDGTTCSRANMHSLDTYEKLGRIGPGDKILVYKANKIVPEVHSCITTWTAKAKLPKTCPVCSTKLNLKISDSGSKSLYCPGCSALV